jgi:ATP-dependent Lhr-like helicase
MTVGPPEGDEHASSAFHLLDERIQRWIWQKQWTELREAQERAIPLLIEPGRDVIIMAATASGKTEAAFLPILTRLKRGELTAGNGPAPGQGLAVYVSPLKALINDQWSRLSELCEHLEIAVTPWHGDIAATRKKRFENHPCGCLLITPESLEAMLIRHGHCLARLFARTQYVVIDELHAFLEGERGRQLQSQLHRLEQALGRRITRVGLSATLGDAGLARGFLRPLQPEEVELIEERTATLVVKVQVKGYLSTIDMTPDRGRAPWPPLDGEAGAVADDLGEEPTGGQDDEKDDGGLFAVAEDLFTLRGSNNLIFPNSRPRVELLADLLRRKCEREGVPNEFWPHHGSLSREIREDAERALKQKERPATAIATTTLELGIDIGAVKRVAQIGHAPSVASLRQRLGRSGRRAGEAAVLLAYAIESPLLASSSISDQLREGLVQICAQIRLLLARWCEPPTMRDLHLSTLVQQLLALIAQNGGMQAADAWRVLCVSGVFGHLTVSEFTSLLRELGARDILQQESSGLLLPGLLGEKLLNHHSFYAAFVSDEEFRIVTRGRTLGTLPLTRPLVAGSFVIFAGRRWKVLSCDLDDRVIQVEPARAGKVPAFDGNGGVVHDDVRRQMRRLLEETGPVAFLNRGAQQLLAEARASYARLGLDRRQVLESGSEVRVLTWRGDRVNDTLATWLTRLGLTAANEGLSVGVFDARSSEVLAALRRILEDPPPTEAQLAQAVRNPTEQKWDWVLPDALLRKGYGFRRFDLEGARQACAQMLQVQAPGLGADEPRSPGERLH